jgi:NAD(P)H-hydrate epimerase
MRAVDRAATDRFLVPSLLLMENAGRGVADVIERGRGGAALGLDVRVVCGGGQNGGDGFVVARHLATRGARVRVILAAPPGKISGPAATNLAAVRALADVDLLDASSVDAEGLWRGFLAGADVVVDAVLGTGLRSDVTGSAAAALRAANGTDSLRVAIDIPSGVDADTGAVHGVSFAAHVTATMGARKLGPALDPGAGAGRVEVVDLGVPLEPLADAAAAVGPLCRWLEPAALAALVPRFGPGAHKGTRGHLLVVAGSAGKTGAALLCGRAALRAGAGLVTVASTAAGQTALDAKVEEVMTARYAGPGAEDADAASYDHIAVIAARMKALALGPGIPTGSGMKALTLRLAAELPLPMVIDADGLNLLGPDAAAVLGRAAGPRVLTPHPGEMARLCGSTVEEVQRDRLGNARRLAAAARAVVVLKGARSIVALPDGEAFINPAASAALGTAGSGDVLTGTIGALLAQGLPAPDAARLGVFAHGLAGEEAARALGSRYIVAGDLPEALARALERDLRVGGGDLDGARG